MPGDAARPTRIIYTRGGGRFANQLMSFGHLIALAEEHPDLQIIDYAFWPYADLCAVTEANPSCAYPPRPGPTVGTRLMSVARRLIWRRRRAAMHNIVGLIMNKVRPRRLIDYSGLPGDGSVVIQLGGEEFLDLVRGRKTALLAGWFLRDWTLLEKHQDVVRRFLAPAERFRRVTLPLSMPGVVAGCLLVFIPALGSFLTSDLLGGAKEMMIGNLVQNQFSAARNWPFGSAASFIVMALVLVALLIYLRIPGRESSGALP